MSPHSPPSASPPASVQLAFGEGDLAVTTYMPTGEEVWERIWQVLASGFRLRREVAEDLRSHFFECWCVSWAEEFERKEVVYWKTWIANRVRWRTKDYLRSESTHRRIEKMLGTREPGGGGSEGTDDGEERHHTAHDGAYVDHCEDPLEAEEWERLYSHAWEQLDEKHQIALLLQDAVKSSDLPDRDAAAAEATRRLNLPEPLSANAWSIKVTRAQDAWLDLLSKVDPAFDHLLEQGLIEQQGKRVAWACRNMKVADRFWLTELEQSVYSVVIEAALGHREQQTALVAAAKRAGRPLAQAEFDQTLEDLLGKLHGLTEGPFLDERRLMEYVAERWDAVQRPAPRLHLRVVGDEDPRS